MVLLLLLLGHAPVLTIWEGGSLSVMMRSRNLVHAPVAAPLRSGVLVVLAMTVLLLASGRIPSPVTSLLSLRELRTCSAAPAPMQRHAVVSRQLRGKARGGSSRSCSSYGIRTGIGRVS